MNRSPASVAGAAVLLLRVCALAQGPAYLVKTSEVQRRSLPSRESSRHQQRPLLHRGRRLHGRELWRSDSMLGTYTVADGSD